MVIGAHYDSAPNTPRERQRHRRRRRAALARAWAGKELARTLRFVLFVNEEPPWFQTEAMGSWVYAKRCRERKEDIVAMLSLETIGYFSDEKGTKSIRFHSTASTRTPATSSLRGKRRVGPAHLAHRGLIP